MQQVVDKARATGNEVNSAIEKFFTRTARLDGRSRWPRHEGHSAGDM